jgi:prophage maintenance system killer protein
MKVNFLFGGSCKRFDGDGVLLSTKYEGFVSSKVLEFRREIKKEIEKEQFGIKKVGDRIEFFLNDITKAFQDIKNNHHFINGNKYYLSMFDWEDFLFFRKG